MNRILTTLLCLMLCGRAFAEINNMDTELAALAEKLAIPIKDHEKKKVAVIDFTDLQGGTSGELGKYIAEQLTVNLVIGKREFSVLDRANLKSILAEHKLTAKGLIDPDNAKKLGMFAGVDALVLGTIVPKGQNISLTAKIITTDTAEIVGAARAEFKSDDTVKQLISAPATESPGGNAGNGLADTPDTVKIFGDLQVQMEPLRIVDDGVLRLNLQLTNKNPKKSLWVAVKNEGRGLVHGMVTDSGGTEFGIDLGSVSGITVASLSAYNDNRMIQATEIRPGESISPTLRFPVNYSRQRPVPGTCKLQLELLVATSFVGGSGAPTSHNLITKIEGK